jgi:hypothetical protein
VIKNYSIKKTGSDTTAKPVSKLLNEESLLNMLREFCNKIFPRGKTYKFFQQVSIGIQNAELRLILKTKHALVTDKAQETVKSTVARPKVQIKMQGFINSPKT